MSYNSNNLYNDSGLTNLTKAAHDAAHDKVVYTTEQIATHKRQAMRLSNHSNELLKFAHSEPTKEEIRTFFIEQSSHFSEIDEVFKEMKASFPDYFEENKEYCIPPQWCNPSISEESVAEICDNIESVKKQIEQLVSRKEQAKQRIESEAQICLLRLQSMFQTTTAIMQILITIGDIKREEQRRFVANQRPG